MAFVRLTYQSLRSLINESINEYELTIVPGKRKVFIPNLRKISLEEASKLINDDDSLEFFKDMMKTRKDIYIDQEGKIYVDDKWGAAVFNPKKHFNPNLPLMAASWRWLINPNPDSVLLPKHYNYRFEEQDEIEEIQKDYNITIVKSKGRFKVIGKMNNIESFIEDLTLGDEQEIKRILR